jgi:rubrerythrin
MADKENKWMLFALESARKLEKEGFEFYTKAAGKTGNVDGVEMFKFLAGEEVKHYRIVDAIIKKAGGTSVPMADEKPYKSNVFEETAGGKVGGKADQLDALNIGIQAEDRSIKAYSDIYDKTSDNNMKIVMKKLVEEEKKHRSILEKEIEFVTDTGEFHDFRTITM